MLADAKFLFISCNCDDNSVPSCGWYPQSFESTQGIIPDNLTHQQQQSKSRNKQLLKRNCAKITLAMQKKTANLILRKSRREDQKENEEI